MTDHTAELVTRLRDASLALQRTAWSRLDGGQDCSLSATLADEAADHIEHLTERLAQVEAERDEAERRCKQQHDRADQQAEWAIREAENCVAATKRIAELEAGLRPFAEQRSRCALGVTASNETQLPCGHCDDPNMTCYRYRRARTLLSSSQGER